ncbi:hypothetical protein FGO68_gene3545 [Halteria grandinella]|uniref:Uncharacterized protein n=1 Tax=Halteria grandinella TaxID=5974 RepID=A0A8J8NZG9_HALGN|nr:hypothetical protein FGO68_gene3545 [Halteria grandinella]
MNILKHGRVIAPKASGYKVSVSALTIIQLFLNGNFTFKRLALTSKRVRAALLTYGLRKNRQLALQVQNIQMDKLSPQSVKQMVEFAEIIHISVWQGEVTDVHDWMTNLDMLSDRILWSINQHKFDEQQIGTKISLSLDVKSLCNQLTLPAEWIFGNTIVKSWGTLKNFLQLMAQVKGLKELKIIDQLFDIRVQSRSGTSWGNCHRHSRVHLSNFDYAKGHIKFLTFQGCKFYGSCHNQFSKLYPKLQVLTIEDAKFSESCLFKKYSNLKILKVYNPIIQACKLDEEQKQVYTDAFKGLTINFVSNMINGKDSIKLAELVVPIQHLEADVNFKESLEILKPKQSKQFILRQQAQMASIGLIPICKLRDYESVFSFSILYQFLESVNKAPNSQLLSPIELRICKFSDLTSRYSHDEPQTNLGKQLKALADWSNLQISSIGANGSDGFVMQLEMNKTTGRGLTLYYDGCQQGSKIEIFGFNQKVSHIIKAKIYNSPIAALADKEKIKLFSLRSYLQD